MEFVQSLQTHVGVTEPRDSGPMGSGGGSSRKRGEISGWWSLMRFVRCSVGEK